MPVNLSVSENVESFSNIQHGSEIWFNQKPLDKGRAEKTLGFQFNSIYILPVVFVVL